MKDLSIMKKYIGFIAIILCVFVVSGCSTDVPKLIEQGKNAFYSGNYSKAKDAFKKCADVEDPEGLFWLAYLTNYVDGKYSATDSLRMTSDEIRKYTFQLLEKSAEKNFGDAYEFMAEYYRDGLGVDKDEKKYQEYLDKAVKLNSARGKARKGLELLDNNPKEGFKLIKESADAGEYLGKALLGYCYIYGNGVDEDIEQGKKLLIESANHKSREANGYLAIIYFWGHSSITQDTNKAFLYAKDSPISGITTYILAYCFAYGEGVEKNEGRGAALARESALRGFVYGQSLWADCCSSGYGTKQEAFEYYMKAAGQGDVYSTARVGEYLVKGTAGKTDYTLGKRYLLKAASEGSNLAKETLSTYGSFLQYY